VVKEFWPQAALQGAIFHWENLMWHSSASAAGQCNAGHQGHCEGCLAACKKIPTLSPHKCPSQGGSGPPSNTFFGPSWVHNPNGISISHFCRAHNHYRLTDHATLSTAIGHIQLNIFVQCIKLYLSATIGYHNWKPRSILQYALQKLTKQQTRTVV